MVDAATVCKRYIECATPGLKVEYERRFMERFGVTPIEAVPAEEAKQIWDEVFMGQALNFSVPELMSAIRTVCEVCSEDDDLVGFKVLMASWKIEPYQQRFVDAVRTLRSYCGMKVA